MKPPASLSQDLSLPFLNPRCYNRFSKFPPFVLAILRSNSSIQIRNCKNPNFMVTEAVRFDGPVVEAGEFESEECELVVETCVTRNLAPALSVEHGIESIKEALEELVMNPPCCSSGVLRFQVAVPPSPKALNWFCCQPDSSGVFPRFFVSKEIDDPTVKSLYLNRTRGVFGIGTAIYFVSPSSNPEEHHRSVRRYLASDSSTITAYGFMDIHFNTYSSSIRHTAGSFYFLIPEIELDEHEDVSILKATLAWDDTLLWTFEKRIQSLKSSIYQVSCHSWPSAERCHSEYLKLGRKKMKLEENKSFRMVSVNALLLERRDYVVNPLELRGTVFSCQFCFWLSPTVGVSNNMLDYSQKMDCSLQDSANINVVWASIIVEECSRLGLTYFCIAPGSRSSPLAIAASSHPLTTCIACFDERSLAFHALGYARGSHKPAVVITSSGTAVSNLLPAVVEASQDFVPLILLTADRPPELHDVGANQAINQVNHFGSFVRFFFNLPPPTDEVPARMVLTTIDSAVHLATSSPYGPVHVNCPFREPLHGSQMSWMSNCLKGLDIWMSSSEPFTKYIQLQHSLTCNSETHTIMREIDKIIQGSKRGLLLIGAVHSDDEIWATLLLARHLNWPIVADILSGLRLRKILPSLCEFDGEFLFIDHFDHALLSDSVRCWVQFDVILQIGCRITSKRVAQMLEESNPASYILIDNHPFRHDPSHLVTHRVQCSILQFACGLVKTKSPCRRSKWAGYLQTLNKMVAWDISFQIDAENSLTEPYVAYVISKSLSANSALFVGNSMAIRDIDMYGCNWESQYYGIPDALLKSELQCLGVRVAGNRGASGIDGLLSTGIGFATGSNKKVLSVIGDISFLHDVNGLTILNQRVPRKPVTIFVINNHGGAIFSLLPIADGTDKQVLNQYFYTSHNISIQNLCKAHRLRYLQAKTKLELQDVLIKSQCEATDCVIEVESCIKANSTFHSTLKKSARRAANQAVSILSRLSVDNNISDGILHYKIDKMEYSKYRIQLGAPHTSRSADQDHNKFHKDGYILSLYLEDGSIGHGEVAPFEIQEEKFVDIEEQLKFILHMIKGTRISFSLSLLKGSFTSWIWNCLGIKEFSIHPSVRCGLEMAILNGLAAKEGSSLLNILQPHTGKGKIYDRTSSVKICALLDSNGAPSEVAHIASSLVEEGFTTIKLKVARRADPIEDAAVVRAIRKKVGRHVELRVDANRNWTYEEAIQFGCHVKDCDLQYIEEPVQIENDILKYCKETGLPVALDETIDKLPENPLEVLAKYTHPAIVAVVIKPSFIGGLEKAALLAQWAHLHGKMAVVSAAFESGLGLSTYILFSYFLEMQNAEVGKIMNRQPYPCTAHGLGTFKWLKEDVTTEPVDIRKNACEGFVGANVSDTIQFLQKFEINRSTLKGTFKGEEVCSYRLTLNSKDFSSSIKVHEVGSRNNGNVVVFLHGFLGTGDDWVPIMKAISESARCISVDLPGHGGSKIENHGGMKVEQEALATLSVEMVAEVLCKLIQQITPGNAVIVGYSMGARIALHMALKLGVKIDGAVIISGSPGLVDIAARKTRQATDDSRARALITYGLPVFLDSWYAGELWKSLRRHPHYKKIASKRLQHDNIHGLAKALSGLSIGRQKPLWEDLKHCKLPLLLVVGEEDHKFKTIAQKMCNEIHHFREGRDQDIQTNICEMVEVPNCGHAVHLEDPLRVVRVLSQFLFRLRKSSTLEQNKAEL